MDLDPDRFLRGPLPMFVIGALGALVTAIRSMPGRTWGARTVNIGCGCLVAGFVTPALTSYLEMNNPEYEYGAAFVVGMLGLSIASAVLDGIRGVKLAEIITGWISRKG